ncbi:MAG: metallophosphoesterase family protein [Anaerolineae bacterium]|nr:metallophosphoesterase family protein [Anaerolineae bacterium]
MRIAVISDIHDNIWNLEKALRGISRASAEALICCGDLCAPFSLKQIADGFDGPVHVVFGNNDGDPLLLSRIAGQYDGRVVLYGIYAELTLGGRQIAVIHYPEPARRIAQAGVFDLVLYGHDHRRNSERIGRTLLANPGEVMGRLGTPTFGLYDTEAGTFEHVEFAAGE